MQITLKMIKLSTFIDGIKEADSFRKPFKFIKVAMADRNNNNKIKYKTKKTNRQIKSGKKRHKQY